MVVEVEGHEVDDPPPPLGAPLGLEPLVDVRAGGSRCVAWTSVVPVIGEIARRRIRYRGSYCGGRMPPCVVGQGEVAADLLVGVVVEVVLDADLVQVDVRVGVAVVGLEVDLVVQAVDVEQLALDVGIGLPRHDVGAGPDGTPEPTERRRR